ncbi:siphovirus Gp157 family protein [Methylobacterium sp. BE186]|uniref:siphovirus Gp157 family protein n=1 Tax=Methylobacterium sp. BE186 TaxID=2817715 RepID=UPI00286BF463|nr:siphovirus Gp157 family protein [Methylobacterium sp. BE186]
MNTPLRHDVLIGQAVLDEIRAAGIDEDDADFAALVDAECDTLERLRRIIRFARHTEAQSKALGEIQAEMRERKWRLDKKAGDLRAAALWALGELGMKKLEAPDFTASVSESRPKVVITDEAAIPDQFCRIKREPDKTALLAALLRDEVPGADLGNGAPSLTVRTR